MANTTDITTAGIWPERKVVMVDNHALGMWRMCPERFRRGILLGQHPMPRGWTPDMGEDLPKAPELQFGVAIHGALDILWTEQDVTAAREKFVELWGGLEGDQRRNPGRGLELLTQYYERWTKRDDLQVASVQCETRFGMELGQVGQWTVRYGGLIDKVIQYTNGRIVVMDHKTTAWNSDLAGEVYSVDNQMKGYVLAAREKLGYTTVKSAIIDLIVLNPKNTEFSRTEVEFGEDVLEEWREDILQTVGMILACWTQGNFPRYGKHPCMSFNKPCPYFELCSVGPKLRRYTEEAGYYTKLWNLEER